MMKYLFLTVLLILVGGFYFWQKSEPTEKLVSKPPSSEIAERHGRLIDPKCEIGEVCQKWNKSHSRFSSRARDPRLDQARDLLREGRFDAAFELLREILAENPNDEESNLEMGMALAQDPSRTKEAESYLRKVISSHPENEMAVDELIHVYKGRSADPSTRDELRKSLWDLLQKNPNSPNLSAAYGRALIAAGKEGEGISYLNKAAQSADEATVASANYSLAELYRRHGEIDKALSSYREIVGIQSKELESMRSRGIDTERAERDLAMNELNVAAMLFAKKNYQETGDILERVSTLLAGTQAFEELKRRFANERAR